ncbi:hypothetical protein [Bradyrhizobium sp. 188]|uniref:hypothetical protein n=1 Tax=Bradyrhizobium sp. 188 TaxID=2782656 RepID=UPI003211AAD7|nr:hypothetical protein [Bradyrhizobium sp. 188]
MGANIAGEDQHLWTNGLVERMNRTMTRPSNATITIETISSELTLPTFSPPKTKLGGWRP